MTRLSRHNIALPLSVVLHAVGLYALSRAPSVVSDASASMSPPAPLVWLEMRAREPAIEPAPAAEEPPNPIEPPEPEPAAPAQESPPKPVPAQQPRATRAEPVEPAPAPTESSPSSPPVPRIDWEKERRAAASAVIQGQEGAAEGRTFSPDDRDKKPQPLPIEPAPPPMVTDNCVIASNGFARFAAQMMGRCVRDANGDLFAAIMPSYLKARPVCVETRPESPGAVTSRGEVISTVKCELVVDEED